MLEAAVNGASRHRHHRIQEYFYSSLAQLCRQPVLSF
jgi:hypothetical protein